MKCPHWQSAETGEYTKKTNLGYRIFKCHRCDRTLNERIGTAFNKLQYPTDIVLLIVMWRIRYKLSLRDLVESLVGAARFRTVFDELRQYFRARTTTQKSLDLGEQRRHYRQCFNALLASYQAA